MSKKVAYGILTIIIISLLSIIYHSPEKTKNIPKQISDNFKNNKTINAYVYKVVDGDTIKVNINNKKETVRLIGIDTPESVHPKKEKNVPEGKIASKFTKSMLEHKNIELEFDVATRDKYNRLLAYVWLNNKMFNKTLLTKGYARIYTFPPNVKYKDDFLKLQKIARNKQIGFWGSLY